MMLLGTNHIFIEQNLNLDACEEILHLKNNNNPEKGSLAAIVQGKNVQTEDTTSCCFSFYFPGKPLVFQLVFVPF